MLTCNLQFGVFDFLLFEHFPLQGVIVVVAPHFVHHQTKNQLQVLAQNDLRVDRSAVNELLIALIQLVLVLNIRVNIVRFVLLLLVTNAVNQVEQLTYATLVFQVGYARLEVCVLTSFLPKLIAKNSLHNLNS